MSVPHLIAKLEQVFTFNMAREQDAQARAEALQQVLTQATQLKPRAAANRFIEGAFDICKRLYELGRSFEIIPVMQLCHDLCLTQDSIETEIDATQAMLKRRVATAHGIVLTENGDYAGAIDCHTEVLKLAERAADHGGIARAWVQIGATFFYAANYKLAIEAYLRAVSCRRRLSANRLPLYSAYIGLAICYFHTGESKKGINVAQKALALETEDMVRQDPVSSVLLRRSYTWLLIQDRKIRRARPLVEQAIHLSAAYPSPRIEIVTLVTRGLYEIGCYQTDIGLTHLHQALEQARHLPVALCDTLTCLVMAEKMAGRPERAAYYLQELADAVYRDRAHPGLETPRFYNDSVDNTLRMIDQKRRELTRQGWGYRSISDWLALERLAFNADSSIVDDSFDFNNRSDQHGIRVGELVTLLAFECGYPSEDAIEIGYASRVHDIGMSVLSIDLLKRKSPTFIAEEQHLLEKHCTSGAEILCASDDVRVMMAMDIAKYHHEWWNGRGYPHGIAGKAIPRPARLCAVADVFDVLISGRDYHPCISKEEAAARLQDCAGKQLDPQLVNRFVKSLQQGILRKYFIAREKRSIQPGLANLLVSLIWRW